MDPDARKKQLIALAQEAAENRKVIASLTIEVVAIRRLYSNVVSAIPHDGVYARANKAIEALPRPEKAIQVMEALFQAQMDEMRFQREMQAIEI